MDPPQGGAKPLPDRRPPVDDMEEDEDYSSGHSDWEELVPDSVGHVLTQVEGASGTGPRPISDEHELPGPTKKGPAPIPTGGIQITLDQSSSSASQKKTKGPVRNELIHELNKSKRETYRILHRASLVCRLAMGLQINEILNKEGVLEKALETLPSERSQPPKNLGLNYLERFLAWHSKTFRIMKSEEDDDVIGGLDTEFPDFPCPAYLEAQLLVGLANREGTTPTMVIFMFIAILRSLGVQVRLIHNLTPLPLKPDAKDLLKQPRPKKSNTSKNSPSSSTAILKEEEYDSSSSTSTTEEEDVEFKARRKQILIEELKKKCRKEMEILTFSSSDSESENEGGSKKKKKKRKKKISPKKRREKVEKKRKRNALLRGIENEDSDNDEIVANMTELVEIIDQKNALRKARAAAGNSFLSSGDEMSTVNLRDSQLDEILETTAKRRKNDMKKPAKYDFWAEVYLEEEERWVSVDVMDRKVMVDTNLRVKATQPVWYVTAFSNSGHVKDVTKRYAAQWHTIEMRERDQDWWVETLKPFMNPRRNRADREEDAYLEQHVRTAPIPKSLSQLKNHGLYACHKQLRKFEGIYPPDTIPVGYIKNEPVYPRSSVHILAGRELWFRKARIVRVGEKPYKVVKGRPRYDKINRRFETTVPDLELFGEWQTEEYLPPVAVDGKVPRSEYGNVQLFLPKMLPIGTVHLVLPGLNRVARKLNIDCAPALIGFEYTAAGCHPKYDGFVVCEEFKEVLLDVWNAEQDETLKKDEAKRRAKIRDRWRKAIRSIMIRRRLEKKYNCDLSKNQQGSSSQKKRPLTQGTLGDAERKRQKK